MYFRKEVQQLYYLGSTLVKSVPLILCGISVLFAYKAGLFNIGVGGQYCLAIGVSLWAALSWHLPWFLCVLVAALAAMAWGALAGALKAFFNINEVIACIMLNWIALYLVNMLMQNETVMNLSISESHKILPNSPGSLIPSLGLEKFFSNNEYVTIAIPLTLVVAVAILVVLTRTTFGYELRATGINKNAAKYAGMQDKRNISLTMAIAGALAGGGAALYWLSGNTEFYWSTYQSLPDAGFNGIPVALLATNNPIGVVFTGVFMAMLDIVGAKLTGYTAYNEYITDVIIAVIVYLSAFSLVIRMWLNGKGKKQNSSNANAEPQPINPPKPTIQPAETEEGGDKE